ncbi:type II secretion system F family protein [Paenibacillus oenotherae]|uniref:Type II secretion system F family protein n=1 Tax=Paenibacillus oenotherae TaxID=1435645 RepID=A0ABS7D9W1_9BACL|nr:type II secretion system F family protein [Paenibacillus oenotherae]MBW7476548.1 type II secretion system F family protein [Paenibacillus oenotherae]
MAVIIGAILTAVWIALVLMNGRAEARGSPSRSAASGESMKRLFMEEPFRLLVERSGLLDRLQPFVSSMHGKLLVLNGASWTIESTKGTIAFTAACGYAAITGGAWLSVLSGEDDLLWLAALVGLIVPAAKWRDTGRKVEERRQNILMSLPEVLNKLMLLLGAGETVQRALMRCSGRRYDTESNPLLDELRKANEAIRNGESFSAALEAFSRRCAVQEVSLFTTTLLLNYRRGGDKLTLSLKELSYTLWEKRKAVARSRGEEASSRLVFPLVGVFLILMVLVASPAVLLLGA